MFKKTFLYFIIWKLTVYWFASLAVLIVPFQPTFTAMRAFFGRLPYLAWVFGNFDGMIYISIAHGAYHSFENAFFPLYPLIVRPIDKSTPYPTILDAQIVSAIAFLCALFILVKLLALDKFEKWAELILLIIILYPTSMFYGAAYNDSLFFLLATACLYFGRKRQLVLASIAGALATLTRLNGLALFFYLLFEYFFTELSPALSFKKEILKKVLKKLSFRQMLDSRIYLIFLIPISFLAYLAYTNVVFGNWTDVFTNMKIWHQDKVVLPPQVVWRYFKILVLYPSFSLTYWVSALEMLTVGIYTFFLVWSFKKIRFSYWIFFFLSILIPALTGTFQGMPRYGLHVYPFFLVVGMFLSQKNIFVKIGYFIISIALLFFVVALFTRGYFVS